MYRLKPRVAWTAIAALTALCLAVPAVANAQNVAEMRAGSSGVDFHPLAQYGGLVLTVSGPGSYSFRAEFGGGESPFFSIFDESGGVLPDGSYTYELTVIPTNQQRRDVFESNQAAAKSRGGVEPLIQSGAFTIADGAIVAGGATEPGQHGPQANPLAVKTTILTTSDGTIQDSLCVGNDCGGSESFGFDTIRLKENNTRIKFQDTSVGTFPTRDWQITANDSTSGGADYLRIDDVDAGTGPLTVEGPGQNNSVWVDSSGNVGGNVGFGTSTPVLDLHVVSGNSPGLRLEQNGSSGFAAQTWDVVGNETNFFVRDATNGSKLPFKIVPNAPTNSLYVANSGNVGLGTASPSSALHVSRSNGTAALRVTDTTATDGPQEMLILESATAANARPRFTFTNGSGTWFFEVNGTNFDINRSGTGSPEELRLESNGNMTIAGTLTQGSSRAIKTDFGGVDTAAVLKQVQELPIRTWSYLNDQHSRHVGPMAEDFHATFGLGQDDKHIAPSDQASLALAAIQGLSNVVQDKDQQIEELRTELAELKQLVRELAERGEAGDAR